MCRGKRRPCSADVLLIQKSLTEKVLDQAWETQRLGDRLHRLTSSRNVGASASNRAAARASNSGVAVRYQ